MEIKIKNKENVKLFEDTYKKENIILLIHADWCYYTKLYIPHWKDFKKSLSNKDLNKFKIFELKDNYKKKLEENKIFKKVFEKFKGYPTTIVINKEGKINQIIGNDIKKLRKEMNKCK